MTEPGAPATYGAVAAGGVTLWAVPLQTWLTITIAVLTVALLSVRLWVEFRRALMKRKEPDR